MNEGNAKISEKGGNGKREIGGNENKLKNKLKKERKEGMKIQEKERKECIEILSEVEAWCPIVCEEKI